MSVFLNLLKEPNDESLHWPFLGTVEFKLLNQLADSDHHVVTLTFDSDLEMRPGITRGYSKFFPNSKLSLDLVMNTQYLMDDTLYFRVTVGDAVKEHRPWLIETIRGT